MGSCETCRCHNNNKVGEREREMGGGGYVFSDT